MKKLLIATDFSANAKHAAEYGYLLAKQMKAGIFICNIITIPAEEPISGMAVWTQEESDLLIDDSVKELKRLKAHLEQTDHTETFRPPVDYLNEAGTVRELVNNVTYKQNVDLVIAGTHEPDKLGSFLLGDHTHALIDACIKPLLIIPHSAAFKSIKKIAFATDFEHPENDLKEIHKLVQFAKILNAEILLTHIYNDEDKIRKIEKSIQQLVVEISNKANYPLIYYRMVQESKTIAGLDWLCAQGQIDVLAMVHRRNGFFDNLLNRSQSQKMAAHISIPLLILPGNS